MFHKNTVLILGAGASAPYGYPTGPALINSIRDELNELTDELRRPFARPDFEIKADESSAKIAFSLLYRRSLPRASFALDEWLEQAGDPEPTNPDIVARFKKLHQLINGVELPSIDEFLRQNRSVAAIGKLIIAIELTKEALEPTKTASPIIQVKPSIYSGDTHWYKYLSQSLTKDADRESIHKNKLKIITFNYDTSLEHYLSTQIGSTEMFSGVRYDEVVPITHTYGQLPNLLAPGSTMEFHSLLEQVLETAQQIRLLDDPANIEKRRVARSAISAADFVFIAGFAADEQNIRYLDMENLQNDYVFQNTSVTAINWDGNDALNQRLGRIGLTDSESILQPSGRSAKLEIADAMANGFMNQPQVRPGIFG